MQRRMLKSLSPSKDLLAHSRRQAMRELLALSDAAEVHAPATLSNLKKEAKTA